MASAGAAWAARWFFGGGARSGQEWQPRRSLREGLRRALATPPRRRVPPSGGISDESESPSPGRVG
eukprot:14234349-Alexandrium_andersonii.AAC.1